MIACGYLSEEPQLHDDGEVRSAEIACNVLDDEDAGEISLAENVVRVPMHPADQFEAFHALAATGKVPEKPPRDLAPLPFSSGNG
jgi:hypothetical protein